MWKILSPWQLSMPTMCSHTLHLPVIPDSHWSRHCVFLFLKMSHEWNHTVLWWAHSKWPTPLCNSFPLSMARTYDLLPISRIWQKWWDVTSLVMLPRLPSIFLGESLDRIILLLALMKQVAMMGRLTWQGTELPVNIQLRTEALYPTAQKKGNHLTNHVSELGSQSCFSQDFTWNPIPGQHLHERP